MTTIFSHNNAIIIDNGSNLTFQCPKSFSLQCRAFLAGATLTEGFENDTYLIEKSNTNTINVLSQIIGQDIKTLYKVSGLPMLGSPFTPAPLISNNQIAKPLNPFSAEIKYPVIVYNRFNNPNFSIDDSFAVADYNANSIAIYTTLEFSNKHAGFLKAKGLYNPKLKTDPNTSDTSPGYIFRKSDIEMENIINNLTGEDTYSKISKQPDYKSKKFGTSFQPTTAGIASTIPSFLPTTKTVEKDPILQMYETIISKLSDPLKEISETKLTHPLGESMIGITGPKSLIENKINEYIKDYEVYQPKIDAELIIGDNKMVILSRKLIL